MARVTTVQRARKSPGRCGKCGKVIEVGDPYRHASPGFHAPKKIRCMDPGCYFRKSDLTSGLMADVYLAQEEAHDELDALVGFENEEDILVILQNCADAAREAAQAYADAAEAMGGAGEEKQERADMIESWCDDLESPSFEEPPDPDDEQFTEDDLALEETWDTWRESVLDEAHGLIDGLEL